MASARGGVRRVSPRSPGEARPWLRWRRSVLLGLLALPPFPAPADALQVVPSLSLSETYTDNVSLAPNALRRSEWVSEVIPRLSIAENGARLRFDVEYAPVLLYYAESKEDNVLQRGKATANAELLRRVLFVDAGARIDQFNVSLQGPLTSSNINTTDNLSTTKTSYLSPYLRQEIGPWIRGEARLTFSTWRGEDQNVLPDSNAGRADLRLASSPLEERFAWDVHYAQELIEYETSQKMRSEELIASERVPVSRTVGLLALAGYESYDSGLVNQVQESPRWSVGLEWTPAPLTRVAGTAGQRFERNAYSFDLNLRTRQTTWSASYKEDITTTRAQFFVPATADTAATLDQLFKNKVPDPVARQKAVEEFIARTGLPPSLGSPVNFYTDQFFVQKRWLANAGVLGVRNNLLASLFRETRTPLFGGGGLPASGDFITSNSIRMSGASVAWSWRITARTTWNLDASYTRNVFLDSGQVNDYSYLRAGLTQLLRARLSMSFFFRRQENVSTVSSSSYTEDAAIAALQMTF